MISSDQDHKFFEVRVLRQNQPGEKSYWERYRVAHEPDMNVISVLQRIAANPTTVDGRQVSPVSWNCNCLEEVCGACTMVVNGRVRQACSALVDNLLKEKPGEIELEPLSKFPVMRDLCVDRSRMFRALHRVRAWVPVDNYLDMGAGPKQSREQQEASYPLSQCMSCGCCLEACPQFIQIDVIRRPDESAEDFQKRKNAAYDQGFVGAHALSQSVLFNSHPIGSVLADERIAALKEKGGVAVCGNAQNCVAVCPKEIPLTTSIAQVGRSATVATFKKFFDK